MKPRVFVLGPTGQVGLFVISKLLEKKREVVAVTRTSAEELQTPLDGLQRISYAQLENAVSGPGKNREDKAALLSCGPVTLARKMVPLAPWERVVVIGTTSIITKKSSPNDQERNQINEIDSGLSAIRQVCATKRIPLTILNPTLIYGCGMDQNLSRVFAFIRRFGFAPLASSALGLRQPLHVEDLARVISNALEVEPPAETETAVCGGSTVTFQQMIEALFEAADRPRRLVRVPRFLVPVIVGLAGLVPGLQGMNSEMFRRQSLDMVFDDSKARDNLGHAARGFHPSGDDFRLPGHIGQVQRMLV